VHSDPRGSPFLRRWQGRGQTRPTTKGGRRRGRGGGLVALAGQLRGHGGRRAPLSQSPQETMGGREDEEEGEIISSPHSRPPLTTSPRLLNFLSSKLGSRLVLIGQNSHEQMPVGCSAWCHCPASRWYVLSFKECVFALPSLPAGAWMT
jgi:hypothetical protein